MEEKTKTSDAEDILSEFNDNYEPKKDVIAEKPAESILDETQPTSKPLTNETVEDTKNETVEDTKNETVEDTKNETVEDTKNELVDSDKPRDMIFVGKKPLMTYVNATLTQLSVSEVVTIKARGKSITQAVDISQMIAKRMNAVGYFVKDVRISSDSLKSNDGKDRNVSTIEIDMSHK